MNKQTTLFYSQTTIEERRLRGQFMTPAALANELADLVPWKRGWKVLDPAVGTGQLLLPLVNKGLQLEG